MKKHYLDNATAVIKLGIKKKNINTIFSLIKQLGFVKESSKVIKTLMNIPSKIHKAIDLLERSNTILKQLDTNKSKLIMIR